VPSLALWLITSIVLLIDHIPLTVSLIKKITQWILILVDPTLVLLSSHWHKPHLDFRPGEESIVEQRFFHVNIFAWHLDHVKSPQNLCHKEVPRHPRHLPPPTSPWAYAEGKQAFEIIFGKLGFIEWTIWLKPALWSEFKRAVEVPWASCLGKYAGLNSGLSC
jgi:hypothetical protein